MALFRSNVCTVVSLCTYVFLRMSHAVIVVLDYNKKSYSSQELLFTQVNQLSLREIADILRNSADSSYQLVRN